MGDFNVFYKISYRELLEELEPRNQVYSKGDYQR